MDATSACVGPEHAIMSAMAFSRRTWIAGGASLAALVALVLLLWLNAAPSKDERPAPTVARLQLQVLAPGGAPGAQAHVALAAGTVRAEKRTDSQGRVQFGPLVVGPARVNVTLPGAARADQILTLAAGDNRVRVALVSAAKIAGAVVDDTGAAIAGAEIAAQRESETSGAVETRSDAQGRFELGELLPGVYALRVRSPRHELAVVPALEAPVSEPVRVVLQRTSALNGEVLDTAGKPAPGATVTIAGSGVWPPKELRSDANGRFELRPVPSGVYELRARLGTTVAPPHEGVVIEPASEVTLNLRLAPGAALRGRVFDAASGAPLAKLGVRMVEDALSGAPLSTDTGADGRFVFEGLRAVPHRVFIYAPGYVAIAGEAREPAEGVQDFALRRAAVLEGSVVDERGAAVAAAELEVTVATESGGEIRVAPPPAPGGGPPDLAPRAIPPAGDNLGVVVGSVPKVPLFSAPLPLTPGAGHPPAPFASDAAGGFRIEGVPAGRVRIVARSPGYAPSRAETKVAAGTHVADLRIVLARGATLLGRLVDAHDYAVAGALVQLELEGEPAPRATLTGSDGRFRFDALRGRCVITAHPLGGAPLRETVALESGEQRELVLRSEGASRELEGRVLDARGFPIASARVRVLAVDARHPVDRTAVSGDDGTFRVTGLPEPPYTVEVEHPDYAAARQSPVSPPAEGALTIALRAGARVHGLVLDRLKNQGIASARVRLRGAREPRTARSDGQGRFEFRNVPDGKYEVIADSEGHISARASFELAGAEARELDPLVLGPGGSVSGDVVDRLGAPVFDAEVALGVPPAWGRAVRTDHRGRFRVAGVEPGDHWVSARHPQAGQGAQLAPVRVYALQESPGLVLRLPGQLDQ